MNITGLELQNFRVYKTKKISNFSNLNIIIGKNGIGKTSILEAIYIGSLTKSFKTSSEYSIINKNESYFRIRINTYSVDCKKKLELFLDKKGKISKINNKIQRKLSDFISQYKVILLSPDEVKLIKDSPSIRRNYFNIQISQLNKEYIYYLNSYNNLIKNKNDFLKKIYLNSNLDTRYLDILDEKIVDIGLKIYNYRKKYIDLINKYINNIFIYYYKDDNIKLEYISDFEENDYIKILKKLKKLRTKEINLGMTSFGIHRDDFVFLHNGNNSKDYSSQGQQKLLLLSLKLSEVYIFKNDYNINPILLLDDLFSELDEKNKNIIFKSLNNDIQIFITTTDLKNIDKKILKKAKIFNLNGEGEKNE